MKTDSSIPWSTAADLMGRAFPRFSARLIDCIVQWEALNAEERAHAYVALDELCLGKTFLHPNDLTELVAHPSYLKAGAA
jgi:hypothetical protein